MQVKREAPKNIVIVGGGTAGWMVASWLQHMWGNQGVQITLVESKDIGIIGVGEGSTPYLRNFFRSLGISDSEWMPICRATYKSGISFPNWSGLPDNMNYFHPFLSHLDRKSGDAFLYNADLRRRGAEVSAHPDDFFVNAAMARAQLAPVPKQTLEYEPDFAYHFDSALLGDYLGKRARGLGVRHVIDMVAQVEQTEQGDIACLHLKDVGKLDGDFFIDCSGFASVLMGKTLQEPFISFKSNLFNDSAVAMPTALNNAQPIPAETVSGALSCGWAWKIPLSSRYGNGYVYDSNFISPEQAENELREHLGGAADGQEARHLKMRVGRISNHWHKNCLAVGLSQGFIEPLEATALMLVQFTIDMFADSYNHAETIEAGRDALNAKINMMFEGVRDYIVAHYHTNSRTDSEYWIANREHRNHSENLQAVLHAWDTGADIDPKTMGVYHRASWYCLLGGMGRFPAHLRLPAANVPVAPAVQARAYCDTTAKELFPSHRDYLHRVYGAAWMPHGA